MRASFGLLCGILGCSMAVTASVAQSVEVKVDARAATTAFPHFWEQTFGSGRAILSLREEYRDDLRTVKKATNFQSIRFHGIFMDEVGLYDPNRKSQNPGLKAEDVATNGIYNFSYVDEIYDGLLANGVKPFVEMSFMPKGLASDPNALHAFWYKQNVSPPKDYAQWDAMITAFAQHLISRYGIAEVATWKFEVWNEPNLDFWGGNPRQATYWEFYDHTARDLKTVSEKIQVGGPSTAQAAWVTAFLAHTKQENVPVDFVSTHVYGNDEAKNIFPGTALANENIPRDRMVCTAVKHVHEEIVASAYPKMPLIFSEYNASYANEPDVTDTTYMGPWMAETIRQCSGLVEAMSYWDFSDVFEEQGVTRTPFYGGFGLIAADEIEKPSFNAFAMLHELGEQRIAVDGPVLATKRSDGRIAIALWNYAAPYGEGAAYTPPPADTGPVKTFHVTVAGAAKNAAVTVMRVDADHGNVLKVYDAMGRPSNPTREQIATLRTAGEASKPEKASLKDGSLTVNIPAQGLVVLLIAK